MINKTTNNERVYTIWRNDSDGILHLKYIGVVKESGQKYSINTDTWMKCCKSKNPVLKDKNIEDLNLDKMLFSIWGEGNCKHIEDKRVIIGIVNRFFKSKQGSEIVNKFKATLIEGKEYRLYDILPEHRGFGSRNHSQYYSYPLYCSKCGYDYRKYAETKSEIDNVYRMKFCSNCGTQFEQ